MSYLTQMLGLTVQNFVSAATGMAVLVALDPRLRAPQHARRIGNFWVDLTRVTLYILLPLSLVLALVLVSQGVVQTFDAYKDACDARVAAQVGRTPPTAQGAAGDDADRISAHGPGRVAGRDQAARHQRRRLLQRQLGAPVREPDAAVATSSRCWRSC